MSDPWIVVPNWERFQHYGTARRPIWIKNYLALLDDEDYLKLTLAERGLLHGIWLAYAVRHGQLRRSAVSQAIDTRSTRDRHFDSLNHAGLLLFSASKPLYLDLKSKSTDSPTPKDAITTRQRRAAIAWIRNGAAAEVPTSQLAAVLADEFKITDPNLIDDLLAQAQEHAR